VLVFRVGPRRLFAASGERQDKEEREKNQAVAHRVPMLGQRGD
jgi:hypothetical protein